MAFTEETVLVLGAGASVSYGYPTGADLIKNIYSALTVHEEGDFNRYAFVDGVSWKILLGNAQNFAVKMDADHGHVAHFKELIDFYDPLSVDAFISQHCRQFPFVAELGKFLIAREILKSEDASKFTRSNLENWYRLLFNAMIAGQTPEELIEQPLRLHVVTFNYDVSLEYYILSRVRNGGFFTDEQKERFLEKVFANITHVYGSVRKISPQDKEITYGWSERQIDGNKIQQMDEALSAKDLIQVMYEQREIKAEVHKTMSAAKRIFILGFAFDEDNLKVLLPKNFAEQDVRNLPSHIYYTNMSKSKIIDDRVKKMFFSPSRSSQPITTLGSDKSVHDALMYDFSLT